MNLADVRAAQRAFEQGDVATIMDILRRVDLPEEGRVDLREGPGPSVEELRAMGMSEEQIQAELKRWHAIPSVEQLRGRSEERPSRPTPQALYYDPRGNSLSYLEANPDPMNVFRIIGSGVDDYFAAREAGDLPIQFPDPSALFGLKPADLARTIEAKRVAQWEPGGSSHALLPDWRERHALSPLLPTFQPNLQDVKEQREQRAAQRARSAFGRWLLPAEGQ